MRLSPGADLSGKVLSLADGFSAAFATPLPSLAPMDLLIGIVGCLLYTSPYPGKRIAGHARIACRYLAQ